MSPNDPEPPPMILWEDPHVLIVAKPAGLLTQGPAGGEATLETVLRRHLRADEPGAVYLATVHRLDRPVSGVIAWAKTPRAARRLAAQFAGRQVEKEYWAIVEGSAPDRPETWDDPLGPVAPTGVAAVVTEGEPGAKRAVTRARALAGAIAPAGLAVLQLEPETGRTHQLRAQSASRGRPIVGDARYGSTRAFPSGIGLHARTLRLVHPSSRVELAVTAPLPAAWAEAGVSGPRPGLNPRT